MNGVGAKKFGMSLETREIKPFFFGGISRDLAGISRDIPKSLSKKKLVFNSFRGFEKGLAGGGWRPTAPKNTSKNVPRIVFSSS